MRLGVDARPLTQSLTGIGRYTLELSRALLDRQLNVRLYAPTKLVPQADILPKASIKTGFATGRMSQMVWYQTALPYWAASENVDVFWGPSHRLPAWLPARVARVVTIHDLVWKFAGDTMRQSNRFLEAWLMPKALAAADMVMADSQNTADDIASIFPAAAEKTRVVYLGNTRFPDALPGALLENLGVNKPYFLFVGTLEPRKNLRRLLEAFSMLPEETRCRAQLVIAGGAGWGEGIDALLDALKLRGSVVLLGYVDEPMLATLYTHALFLAMPSLYEGFGLPVVEAMSFGKPVLVGAGSLPEIAGSAGLAINPLDVDSIMAGLAAMLDSVKLGQWAAFAKSQAEVFSWERAAGQAMAVFEEAQDRSRSRCSGNKFF